MRRLCLLEVLPVENREGDAVLEEERLRRGMMPSCLVNGQAGVQRPTVVLCGRNETGSEEGILCYKVGSRNGYVQTASQSRQPSLQARSHKSEISWRVIQKSSR